MRPRSIVACLCALSRLNPLFGAVRMRLLSWLVAVRCWLPARCSLRTLQIIDLSGSEDEILKGMKSNNRNLHRNIQQEGRDD